MELPIEEIKKLDAERTQGVWEAIEPAMAPGMPIRSVRGPKVKGKTYYGRPVFLNLADADFIAAAPKITKQYIELYGKYEKLQKQTQLFGNSE